MNEVTLLKCHMCGHFYEADKKHKCKPSERFSYQQGLLDGQAKAYETMNEVLDKLQMTKEQGKRIEMAAGLED